MMLKAPSLDAKVKASLKSEGWSPTHPIKQQPQSIKIYQKQGVDK
jgi:hypothetical protein